MVATHGQEELLAAHWDVLKSIAQDASLLDTTGARALVPALRDERVLGAVFEPGAADMDVNAIHQGYLRGLRRAGGRVVCDARVSSIERVGGVWRARAGAEVYEAPTIVNAAGAWADVVATLARARPIGLQPRRRSAFIFAPPADLQTSAWPMTAGLGEDWYIKPDAGMMLGSPANADPVEPQDVQPEEIDIATAIHRIEEMTTLSVRRPSRTWAGLRSFVADGDLVGGFDAAAPGFFWVAGQGGYGIQTSAAMGESCAALLLGRPLPERIARFGLDAAMLSPKRLFVRA
jgi:D-arginine dehydrogenase